MEPNQINVVVVGGWNPKVFTPAWVKEQMLGLKGDEAAIDVLLDFQDMDYAYKYKSLFINPKRTVLELKLSSFGDDDVILLELALKRVLELLPQTPIKALGINIVYVTDNNILAGLQFKGLLPGFGITSIKSTMVRDTYQLNCILDLLPTSGVSTTFNYHFSSILEFDYACIKNLIQESKELIK